MNGIKFNIGDKVMRVAGREVCTAPSAPYCGKTPEYGEVYCVEDCWPTILGHHQVMLIGFGGPYFFNGLKTGWPAPAFRKVEEIKLISKALEKILNKKSQEIKINV
jgi:hypothetical protein